MVTKNESSSNALSEGRFDQFQLPVTSTLKFKHLIFITTSFQIAKYPGIKYESIKLQNKTNLFLKNQLPKI